MPAKTATKSKQTTTPTNPAKDSLADQLAQANALNDTLFTRYGALLSLSRSVVAEIDNLMTSNLTPEETSRHLGNIVANYSKGIDAADRG